MQLCPVASDDYARTILPQTFDLWGNGRDYETYVADFLKVANSRYGRRRPFTVGLVTDGVTGATCKLYAREMHWGEHTLRAVGIGAVYTPNAQRGRGYATAMLGTIMDAEAQAGTDLAFLFSDIAPIFYERLGFKRLPSRDLTVRANSLDGTPSGAVPLEAADWPQIRRCFDALEATRPWGFARTPLVWEWLRLVWDPGPERGVQPVNLVVRSGRSIIAYALGQRVTRSDTFFVNEFGFRNDAGRAVIGPLLRAAAGDLARVGGWLPPDPARAALPRGYAKARRTAIFMVAPLSPLARSWWKANAQTIASSTSDAVWCTDHV